MVLAEQPAGQGMSRFQHDGEARRMGKLREDVRQEIARFGLLAELGQGHRLPDRGVVGRLEALPGRRGGKPLDRRLIKALGEERFAAAEDHFAAVTVVAVFLQIIVVGLAGVIPLLEPLLRHAQGIHDFRFELLVGRLGEGLAIEAGRLVRMPCMVVQSPRQ